MDYKQRTIQYIAHTREVTFRSELSFKRSFLLLLLLLGLWEAYTALGDCKKVRATLT